MQNNRAPEPSRHPMGRTSSVFAAALVLATGCGAKPAVLEETAPEAPARADERADAARLACGRVDAFQRSVRGRLDLGAMTTEGGRAEVFGDGDAVTEIRGGLLGETFRFAFDYRYRDGELLCATETITSMHTIAAARPGGPPPRWRFDLLVFDGPELVSRITERAPHHARPYHPPDEVRAFAARLLEMAARVRP